MAIVIKIDKDISPQEAWDVLREKLPDYAEALADLIADGYKPEAAAMLAFAVTGDEGLMILIREAGNYVLERLAEDVDDD